MPNSYKDYENSITLATVEDGQQGPPGPAGADGDSYRIDTNYDFIYVAIDDEDTGSIVSPNLIFSPSILKFTVYKNDNITNGPLIPGTDYVYGFEFLGPITITPTTDWWSHLEDISGLITIINNQVCFNIDVFSTQTNKDLKYIYDQCMSGNAFFIFRVYKDSNAKTQNKVLEQHGFYVQNLLTSDGQALALFKTTAVSVEASVQNASMAFTADGLNIYNGALNIYDNGLYAPVSETTPITDKIYYQHINNQYVMVDNADPTHDWSDFPIGYYEDNQPTLNDAVFRFDPGDSVNNIPASMYIRGSGHFEGDGIFSGKIYASEGEFNGKITALSGTIGGFNINSGSLSSTYISSFDYLLFDPQPTGREEGKIYYIYDDIEDTYIVYNDVIPPLDPSTLLYYRVDNPSIVLDGINGAIEANDITLGSKAKIKEYIQLGTTNTAYIYNPDYAASQSGVPYFLKVGNNTYLTSTGILRLNGILIDGATSCIYGDSNGLGWPAFSITPELATFPNIDVGRGKISAAVFEIGRVQAVGGSMLFKPSFYVVDYSQNENDTQIKLDISSLGTGVDLTKYFDIENNISAEYILIYFNNGDCTHCPINGITGENNDTIVLNNFAFNLNSNNYPTSVIILGVDKSVIIGVNSTDSNAAYLKPRGITIAEFNKNLASTSKDSNYIPKVFLGDLEKSGFTIEGFSGDLGYGLYSDNVILNGSLTTRINSTPSSTTFAGVNTLSKVNARIFEANGIDDSSKIVFWAGSAGNSAEQIAGDPEHLETYPGAPFQVTERGSLYARDGLFEGVIISKSRITGVDLYAARIHGVAKDSNIATTPSSEYGLAFYDLAEGIVFKTGGHEDTDPNVKTVFGLGSNGLYTSVNNNNNFTSNYFISIDTNDNQKVNFIGYDVKGTNTVKAPIIASIDSQTEKNNIVLGNNSIITYHTDETILSRIDTDNNKISITHGSNIAQLDIFNNEINLNTTDVILNQNLTLGNITNKYTLRYKQVSLGYDLYIEQKENN